MKKKSILLLPLILFGMVLAGCHGKTNNNSNSGSDTVTPSGGDNTPSGGDNNPSGGDNTPTTVAVSSVVVTPGTLSLGVGEHSTLRVDVLPDGATDKTVTWASDHPEFATVVDGYVTGVAAGEAVITATSNSDSTKVGRCAVTVTAADPGPGPSPVDNRVFQVIFGEGQPVQLTSTTPDTGVDEQFKADGLTVHKGDAITFKLDGEVIRPGDENEDGKPHNGNNTSGSWNDGYVVHNDAENVSVFLKLYHKENEADGYSFWLAGYEAGDDPAPVVDNNWYLLGTFNEWASKDANYVLALGTKTSTEDGNGVDAEKDGHPQYFINDVELQANAEVKFRQGSSDNWIPAGTGNIEIAEAGTYNIYLVPEATSVEGWDGHNYYFAKQGGSVIPPEPETHAFKYALGTGEAVAFDTSTEEDIEDNEHNVIGKQYEAKLQNVAAETVLKFYDGETELHPGASGTGNNAVVNENVMTVRQAIGDTEKSLFFKYYFENSFNPGHPGYDVWLAGYVAPKAVNTTLKVVFGAAVPEYVDLYYRGQTNEWGGTKLTPNEGRTEFSFVLAEVAAGTYEYVITAQAKDSELSWDNCTKIVKGEGNANATVALVAGEDAVVTLHTFTENPDFSSFNPEQPANAIAAFRLVYGAENATTWAYENGVVGEAVADSSLKAQYKFRVTLAQDEGFKFLDNTKEPNVWLGRKYLENNAGGKITGQDDGDGDIVANAAVVLDVYLKLKNDDSIAIYVAEVVEPAGDVTYTLNNTKGWDVFSDSAKVYAWVWGGSVGGAWVACSKVDGTHLSFTVDGTATGCKIVRFASTVTEPSWEVPSADKWNESGDIALDGSTLAVDYQIGD